LTDRQAVAEPQCTSLSLDGELIIEGGRFAADRGDGPEMSSVASG